MPFSNRRIGSSRPNGKPAKEKAKEPIKRYLISLLSQREYSTKGLRKKALSKEYAEDEVDAAIAWALEKDYVSDERYASGRARLTSKKHGNRRLTLDLQQKGIAADLAKAQLENLPPEDERVLDVVRKFEGKPLTRELRQKIYRFLGSRGFMGKPVKAAFQHLEEKLQEAGIVVEDADDDFFVDD